MGEFAGFDELAATQWVFENYGNQTTTIAKIQTPAPDGTGSGPNPGLFDFVVKHRMFAFYLHEGCNRLHKEHAFMETMVKTAKTWPDLIPVWGYDSTQVHGVSLWEAETLCVNEFNMGQIASDGF